MACPLRLQKARRPIPVVSSSSRYILFGSALERKLVREAATASCAFDAGRRRPRRDGTSELIRATECLDVMGHRTDAVDSQKLVGTITQASGHRVKLGRHLTSIWGRFDRPHSRPRPWIHTIT